MSARPQRQQRGWVGAALFCLSALSILCAFALSYLGSSDVPTFAKYSAFVALLGSGSISSSQIITLIRLWRSRGH